VPTITNPPATATLQSILGATAPLLGLNPFWEIFIEDHDRSESNKKDCCPDRKTRKIPHDHAEKEKHHSKLNIGSNGPAFAGGICTATGEGFLRRHE
jgi:hypothetical protein